MFRLQPKLLFCFFHWRKVWPLPIWLSVFTLLLFLLPVPHKKLQSIIYVWGQETFFSTRLQHLSWCFLVLSDCVTSKSLIFDLWVLKKEGYQISSSHQETEWVLRTDRSSQDMLSRASTPSFQEDHHPWVVHGLKRRPRHEFSAYTFVKKIINLYDTWMHIWKFQNLLFSLFCYFL